ncbi:MAG: ATP-dependent DNA helicase RecG [Gammaproteobacteria bacterium]|nr:ATP-dependent DNA helicase RecG [Gammaproteobacteria bacterium]
MENSDTADSIPVSALKGIGPRIAERLKKLNIETVQDVLFHLPLRYEDRTRIIPIGTARPGHSVVVEGVINHAEITFSRRGKSRRMLLCHISDGTGSLLLRFFYFNKQQQSRLVAGARIRCFAELRYGASALEMIHPEYTVLSEHESVAVEDKLTPVYPTTEGVHQTLLRKITDQALSLLQQKNILPEYLPDQILKKYNMPSLVDALGYVHRPPPDADLSELLEGRHRSQQKLAFEELLAQHLSLQSLRQKMRKHNSYQLASANHLIYQFIKSLPFDLTAAQQKVNQTVLDDLEQASPMMRLVQGDVGSGKTVVAATACLKAVEAGYQAAIMAPTEILAEQHYQNFSHWLQPLGLKVAWLSGKLKGKPRQAMLELLKTGEAAVAVGTHALFQDEVTFAKLALIVIDEQHRFGVHQRLALREKGASSAQVPHQLIMTATPIPRSLAMTAYADLDYSVIDELPPGRTPVATVAIPESRRDEVIQRVEKAGASGRQIYWVCTLIEESDALQCQAAEDTAALLTEILPNMSVGLVHGRMKATEKEQVMQAFKRGEINLLVATTVIEVGVDVPNATLIIIENAERLGLAQLHQLRGRVGRGIQASHCVLMYRTPLSELAKSRLAVMRETSSGFDIAKKDLELRGPGEVLGTRQTGLMQLRIADIVRDEHLLDDIKQVAEVLYTHFPDRVRPVIRRWLGQSEQYGLIG